MRWWTMPMASLPLQILLFFPTGMWEQPNPAQCWVAVGSQPCSMPLAPVLPGGSHMSHRGNAFPFVLPLDLNGSLVFWYNANTRVEKHIFSAGFNCSQEICFTQGKNRVLGFLGLISLQRNWMLRQIWTFSHSLHFFLLFPPCLHLLVLFCSVHFVASHKLLSIQNGAPVKSLEVSGYQSLKSCSLKLSFSQNTFSPHNGELLGVRFLKPEVYWNTGKVWRKKERKKERHYL